MLELRRLQALQAVVATGSVKNAALRLGYTPSAISQHISTLEVETRTTLLEPAGRGVRPTAAGRLLAEHAEALLARMADTEAALAALNAAEAGAVRLASFATAGGELVPPALATVHRQHPGLELRVRVADRDEAMQLLRQDLVDVAVVETHPAVRPRPDTGITLEPLLIDPFRLVVPRGHRFDDPSRPLPLAAATDEAWIDIRCEVGCCRDETTEAFRQAGFTPRRSVEADDYWPAQGFVAVGLGLALVPALALGVLHPGVSIRPLAAPHRPTRHIALATRSTAPATAAVRSLLAALRTSADRSGSTRAVSLRA